MVTMGLPQIHLPGSSKFISYKTSLQDYCAKNTLALPKYFQEQTDLGFVGAVSFGSNHVKCKVVAGNIKEANALAAYEALTQLGYLNGRDYVPQRNLLKRKDSGSIELDTAKQIKRETGTATPKARLNELCQKLKLFPTYHTIKSRLKFRWNFISTVTVGKAHFTSATVHSKAKDAEQDAAQVALNDDELFQQANVAAKNNASSCSTAGNTTADKPHISMKNRLQEYCQKQGAELPHYEVQFNEEGGTFTAMVTVQGVEYFGVSFPTKKAAESYAAEVALTSLGVLEDPYCKLETPNGIDNSGDHGGSC